MSDHDPLESFANSAGNHVAVPDFDRLVSTSRRRRRTSMLSAGIAAAAVVGVVTVGVYAVESDSTPQPSPADSPNSVVDSPSAHVLSVAISPDDPAARAVVWASASGQPSVLALTADGFQTRTTLPVSGRSPHVDAAGPGWFYVAEPHGSELVSPQGAAHPVHVSGPPRPLAAGEYLVTAYTGQSLAVDPATAQVHLLRVPAVANEVFGSGQLIWSIAYTATPQETVHSRIVWSLDGGRTWSSHNLPSGPLAIYSRVPSADSSMVVMLAGDTSVTSLSSLISSDDDGLSWRAASVRPSIGISWAAARPDGSLLAYALAARNGSPGHPASAYSGLMMSDGHDWSHLKPLQPRFSGSTRTSQTAVQNLVTTATDHGVLQLYAYGGLTSQLLTSRDGGRTWTVTADR